MVIVNSENLVKNNKLKMILIWAGFALLAFLVFICLLIYHFFFDINAIKPGYLISKAESPDGDNSIYCYLNNGGATTSYHILCTLHSNETGKEKNIYWAENDRADVEWVDNDTVIINGITLENVEKDTYDFRNP